MINSNFEIDALYRKYNFNVYFTVPLTEPDLKVVMTYTDVWNCHAFSWLTLGFLS